MKSVLQEILDRIRRRWGRRDGSRHPRREACGPSGRSTSDLASAEWIGLAKRATASLRAVAAPGGRRRSRVKSQSGPRSCDRLGGDYFLCVVVGPECIPGRARSKTWRAGLQLEQALA